MRRTPSPGFSAVRTRAFLPLSAPVKVREELSASLATRTKLLGSVPGRRTADLRYLPFSTATSSAAESLVSFQAQLDFSSQEPLVLPRSTWPVPRQLPTSEP